MGQRRTDWQLFLDEGGNLANASDCAVLAGFLLRGDIAAARAGLLRRTLIMAIPELPWPLHAAYLNRPVYLALAEQRRLLREQTPSGDAHFASLVSRTIAHLKTTEKQALTDALGRMENAEAVGRRSEPRFDALTQLDRALRTSRPDLWEELAARARKIFAELQHVLEAVDFEAHEHDAGRLVAALVSCSDSEIDTDFPSEDERYRALLQALLERVRDLVHILDGTHQVSIWVLTRDVRESTTKRRVPLMPRHVGEIAQRVVQTGPANSIRLIAAGVPKFDAKVDARLVLADFAANRARWYLASRNVSLENVEKRICRAVVLPVRTRQPGLSHLAATGPARALVEAARQRIPPPVMPLNLRRWALQQAQEWECHFR